MGLGKAFGRSLVFKRQSEARSTQKMLRLFFSDSLCFHNHHLPTKWWKKVWLPIDCMVTQILHPTATGSGNRMGDIWWCNFIPKKFNKSTATPIIQSYGHPDYSILRSHRSSVTVTQLFNSTVTQNPFHKKPSSQKGIQKFEHKKWHCTNTLHEKARHEKTGCEQTWCEQNMPWLTTNSWATSILCNQTNDYRNHCMKKHSIQTSRHEKWHCMQKHGMKKALCEEHVMKIRL